MFKNARFYRLSGSWPESEAALTEELMAARFTACGPLNETSIGWERPYPELGDVWSRRVGGVELLQLRRQTRLLPAAAIKEALEVRIEEYRERMGQNPPAREKRRLKEQTRDTLMPKALLRSERIKGCVLLAEQILVVDAATSARAELFVEFLRASRRGLEASPLAFKRPVSSLLTRIFLGDPPRGFVLGRECRMQDPSDNRASVRWSDFDLTDPNVRKHVRDGMTLSHLGLEFESAMSCVLDEHGGLGKIRLPSVDAADTGAEESPLARLDAELVLLGATLRRFVAAITEALGGIEEARAA